MKNHSADATRAASVRPAPAYTSPIKAFANVTVVVLVVIAIGVGFVAFSGGLVATGAITGTLETVGGFAPGLPRPHAGSVTARNVSSGAIYRTTAGRSGQFVIEVPPGTYSVSWLGGTNAIIVHVGPGKTVQVKAYIPIV